LFDSPLSLYGPASAESSDVALVDTIADSSALNEDALIDNLGKRDEILILFKNLDSLGRQVLSLRFGLDDGLSKSVQQVASLLALSCKDVQLIERQSIKQLQNY